MDIAPEWDDVLDGFPEGWSLGPVRFYHEAGEWQACAETRDGRCVMANGPDCASAMADLVRRLEALLPH